LLLGPIYPCATKVFTRLLDWRIQVSSLAFISAMGSSGGAIAPFVTGLVAQREGTWVLFPVSLGLFGIMGAMWAGLPRLHKRSE
jgi:fucose permease